MSFFAHIETELETYALWLPDGHLGGDQLLEFLTALDNYLWHVGQPNKPLPTEGREDPKGWFAQLEAKAKEPFSQVGEVLCRCYYASEYTFNELSILSQVANTAELKAYAQSLLTGIADRQANIHQLIASAQEFQRLFTELDLEERSWYQPSHTVLEVQALIETLNLARTRRAKQVRIRFS